jgi:hypothetical protein
VDDPRDDPGKPVADALVTPDLGVALHLAREWGARRDELLAAVGASPFGVANAQPIPSPVPDGWEGRYLAETALTACVPDGDRA